MKQYTTEERAALIADCKVDIVGIKQELADCCDDGYAQMYLESKLARQEIALAALTAEPLAVTTQHQIDSLPSDSEVCMWSINTKEDGDIYLYTTPPVVALEHEPDYFDRLVSSARERAEKAMRKFPQPNYVLNKVAEESGEVIKAVIHYTEGREEWLSVEGELIDNLAMLIRLVKEGDQVIGFSPPDVVKRLNSNAPAEGKK